MDEDRTEHRIVDQTMLAQVRPAMHDPMPNGRGEWHLGLSQKVDNPNKSILGFVYRF